MLREARADLQTMLMANHSSIYWSEKAQLTHKIPRVSVNLKLGSHIFWKFIAFLGRMMNPLLPSLTLSPPHLTPKRVQCCVIAKRDGKIRPIHKRSSPCPHICKQQRQSKDRREKRKRKRNEGKNYLQTIEAKGEKQYPRDRFTNVTQCAHLERRRNRRGGFFKRAHTPYVCRSNMREHEREVQEQGPRKRQTNGNRTGKREAQGTKPNGGVGARCVCAWCGESDSLPLWQGLPFPSVLV